jgi:hypothetical protein
LNAADIRGFCGLCFQRVVPRGELKGRNIQAIGSCENKGQAGMAGRAAVMMRSSVLVRMVLNNSSGLERDKACENAQNQQCEAQPLPRASR